MKKIKFRYLLAVIFSLAIFTPIVFAGGSSDDSPCPSGYTYVGNNCTKSIPARQRNGIKYCDPGDGVLKGNECVSTITPKTIEKVDDSKVQCADGYEKINGTCLKYYGPAYQRSGQYYCSPVDGVKFTLVGVSCYVIDEENSIKAKIIDSSSETTKTKTGTGPSMNYDNLCQTNDGVKNALRIIGYIVLVAKWAVPILIIILGSIDFAKASISDDEQAINKAGKALIRRVLTGLLVFLIPTILTSLLELIGYVSKDNSRYACVKCALNINKSDCATSATNNS